VIALGELHLVRHLWWTLSNQLVQADVDARLVWRRVITDDKAWDEFQFRQNEVWEILTCIRNLSLAIDEWRVAHPDLWPNVKHHLGEMYFVNSFLGVSIEPTRYPN